MRLYMYIDDMMVKTLVKKVADKYAQRLFHQKGDYSVLVMKPGQSFINCMAKVLVLGKASIAALN